MSVEEMEKEVCTLTRKQLAVILIESVKQLAEAEATIENLEKVSPIYKSPESDAEILANELHKIIHEKIATIEKLIADNKELSELERVLIEARLKLHPTTESKGKDREANT